MTTFTRAAESISHLLSADPAARYGVAVSGGGDSIALLHLLLRLGFAERLTILHYNHRWSDWGNRAEQAVGELTKQHNLKLVAARGSGKPVSGNAEAAARTARYRFFAEAAAKHKLNAVLTAHTQTDQAEGVLMRLARGSGLTGLSGIKACSTIENTIILRPLLTLSRAELRTWMKRCKIKWLEDPANTEDDYLRARLRKLMPQLAKAGLEESAIAASAASLQRAETTLTVLTESTWQSLVKPEEGGLALNRTQLLAQPEDLAQRLIARAVTTLTNTAMAPRLSKRLALLHNLKTSKGKTTLGGVIWSWTPTTLTAIPEKPLFLAPKQKSGKLPR